MSKLLTTPLTKWHIDHNAKMAEFAGYNMPIQYTSIIEEHIHTRTKASVFDICHMGEFIYSGEHAEYLLGNAVTHNLEKLAVGKCKYGFLLNDNGGILDDLIIYKVADGIFNLVVNAACLDSDFEILSKRLNEKHLVNVSNIIGKIDLQGPKSCEVLEKLFNQSFKNLGYFSFTTVKYKGKDLMLSRTGYTGELGYELYVHIDSALDLWKDLLKNPLVLPAGLGARDTLRLEAGLPLYGHDLDDKHTPVEAGFEAMLNSTAKFIGKEKMNDVKQKLVPLVIEGKRATRQGDIIVQDNKDIGVVTSGSYAPSIEKIIALAYIDIDFSNNNDYTIKTSKTELVAHKASLPFYTGTARIKL